MSYLIRAIRFLFLVKEIISKEGSVHFRRYRLLSTPWFNLYIHHILKSDMEIDPHDHPWNFHSLILKGSYTEMAWFPPAFERLFMKSFYPGDIIKHKAEDAHRIALRTRDVWTLVFTYGKKQEWGFRTKEGWVDHLTYRQIKNQKNESRYQPIY